ncbi:hypothetical protein SAMN04488074_13647 [Lentzea albidocapillata subsp. violacea]|uniref:Uncharacterized protein n=1 Tax=Lentzea albidocapillata subsp. violacea TaxID=128104 RepID=A0A1G9Z1S4_9PSEU|nr:hypothetical protein [Lentzea albidocapillata]SDN14663.1 hypothetical protein SAMN04488074_13647 [Lentzea albidocapillata subsp. violacea]
MGRASDDIAEAEGRRWRDAPAFAARLAAVERWRAKNETSPLLDVLGRPAGDEWTVGQDYALGQILAHLQAGDLLLTEVNLAAANTADPSPELLRAALRPHGHVHDTVAGGLFARFPMMPAVPVRQLWAPVPDTRSLASPSTIPVLLGTVTPAAVLGALRAQTAVARWPAGHRCLSVLLTHPVGAVLHVSYPVVTPR